MINFFKKLDLELQNYQNVIIMGHKNPDLDSFGSALGLVQVIDLPCYIYINNNNLTRSVLKAYKQIKDLETKFVDKSNYHDILTKNTLIIIVDLHKEQLLEYPNILKETENVIIIDHHILGPNKIKSICEYIDPTASSTVEIVTKYIEYKKKKLPSIIATIMLTGVDIDTNGYNMKTTEATYKVSAFLMSMGANNILKQTLLKENKEEYIKRTKQIEKSYMLENIILCPLDEQIYNPSYLATMSEDLLRFENVEASFTIGKIDNNKIGISARSLGKIDVEEYMRKMGGGGHKTDAACQFENTTIEESEKQLKKILKENI